MKVRSFILILIALILGLLKPLALTRGLDDRSFVAVDGNGNGGFGIQDSISFTTVQGWNLLSLPLIQDDMTPGEVFGDDFGEDFFSVYEYGGVLSGYLLADTLVHGQGFWLNSSDSRAVTAVGRREAIVTGPLRVDWNLIGNPFPDRIEVCNLRFSDGTEVKAMNDAARAGWLVNAVYSYSGGGYVIEQSVLEPWLGYWISLLRSDISIHYELREFTQGSGSMGNRQSIAGNLMVVRVTQEREDETLNTGVAWFGIDGMATSGFDPDFDAPMPPAPFHRHSLQVGFESSWDRSLLLRDIRNTTSERWNLVVTSTDTGRVLVSWVTDGVADRLEFIILNSREEIVAESDDDGFEFTLRGRSEHFIVERRESVGGNSALNRK